jgi:hypothetical protein
MRLSPLSQVRSAITGKKSVPRNNSPDTRPRHPAIPCAADDCKFGRGGKDQPQNPRPRRAQGKTDCHLLGPQSGRECNDAVDSESRQEYRRDGKSGDERGVETAWCFAAGNSVLRIGLKATVEPRVT